jgi:head-tail adaptor
MKTTPSGLRLHRVTFENPGPPIPDGDGGWITTWAPTDPPSRDLAIVAATQLLLEREAAGTVIATATHLMTGPWHPQVTTQTRAHYKGRTFEVGHVVNRDERDVEMVIVATELVP